MKLSVVAAIVVLGALLAGHQASAATSYTGISTASVSTFDATFEFSTDTTTSCSVSSTGTSSCVDTSTTATTSRLVYCTTLTTGTSYTVTYDCGAGESAVGTYTQGAIYGNPLLGSFEENSAPVKFTFTVYDADNRITSGALACVVATSGQFGTITTRNCPARALDGLSFTKISAQTATSPAVYTATASNLGPGNYKLRLSTLGNSAGTITATTGTGIIPSDSVSYIKVVSGISDTSAVLADPHVLGFDGNWYNFPGYTGGTFCLLSTPHMALNARFTAFDASDVQNQFMRHLALALGPDTQVHVEAVSKGQLAVEVNGEEVGSHLVPGYPLAIGPDSSLTMYYPGIDDGQTVVVDTADMRFWFYIGATEAHLNMQMKQIGDYTCKPYGYAHGVVGQTLTRAPLDTANVTLEQAAAIGSYTHFIEGEMEDYVVDNLFSTNFKYNRFTAAPQADSEGCGAFKPRQVSAGIESADAASAVRRLARRFK